MQVLFVSLDDSFGIIGNRFVTDSTSAGNILESYLSIFVSDITFLVFFLFLYVILFVHNSYPRSLPVIFFFKHEIFLLRHRHDYEAFC